MRVRKYLESQYLIKILEDKKLYFGSIKNYEDSDINEGRVTDSFLKLQGKLFWNDSIKNLFQDLPDSSDFQTVFDDASYNLSQQARADILRTIIARDHSYIQCWTKNLNENELLWNTFGDGGMGASIISTIENLNDILNSYSYLDEEHLPFDGPIFYNRESLLPDDIAFLGSDQYLSPCFSLSGRDDNHFMHENEYRFLLINQTSFHVDWSETYDENDEITGSFIEDIIQRRIIIDHTKDEIFVPFDSFDFVKKVILGEHISKNDRQKITKLCRDLNIIVADKQL